MVKNCIFNKAELEEKVRAVMIGHAVGDALGVPVEFVVREKLDKDPVRDMRGYGTYPVPSGAWSDDTSMSLCALDVLARGEDDWKAVMDNFVDWIEMGGFTPTGEAFDVGRTCLSAIMRYMRGEVSATECGGADEYSNGNGSLMRIHPFVLMSWALGEGDGIIGDASALTHAHKRSILACRIYYEVLCRILDHPERTSVLGALERAKHKYGSGEEGEHFFRIFAPDFALTPREEIKSSGYVVDTLEAAVWCLLNTESFEECVLTAVNLGGDTDTVAAVAGGLAGALYGYDAIPKEWRDTLLRREYIEDMCHRAAKNWLIK